MGAKGDPERGKLRQILKRSHDWRIRGRHLEHKTVPSVIAEAERGRRAQTVAQMMVNHERRQADYSETTIRRSADRS
jgi:hypothetical protein